MFDPGLATPTEVIFERGAAALVAERVCGFGQRVLLVRGRSVMWTDRFADALVASGCDLKTVFASGEPQVDDVDHAIAVGRDHGADCVVAVGGGAVIDLGKAVAALIPSERPLMDHLEVIGKALPLHADPLPFVALPTTSGTGAEVTKNAVIGSPAHGRKVSLRDARMVADLAVIDPALTDNSPRGVTLASGLDAIVQVIEPYLSCRSTPLTDDLCRDAIPRGLRALERLMQCEDSQARDDLALTSLYGGVALANAGLGAVHGFAGVLGGRLGLAHGVICGRLLPASLAVNLARAVAEGQKEERFDAVLGWFSGAFGCAKADAVNALNRRINDWGLPPLQGLSELSMSEKMVLVEEAKGASSMAANPFVLADSELLQILDQQI